MGLVSRPGQGEPVSLCSGGDRRQGPVYPDGPMLASVGATVVGERALLQHSVGGQCYSRCVDSFSIPPEAALAEEHATL